MSPFPPEVTSKDVVRVAVRVGFMLDGESGRHAAFYRDSDHRRVVIPTHVKGSIKAKALLAIVKDLGLEPEQFSELL